MSTLCQVQQKELEIERKRNGSPGGAYRLLYPSNNHFNINLMVNIKPEFSCGIKVLCDPKTSLPPHTPIPTPTFKMAPPLGHLLQHPHSEPGPLFCHHQILHAEPHFSIATYVMTISNDIR